MGKYRSLEMMSKAEEMSVDEMKINVDYNTFRHNLNTQLGRKLSSWR